MVAGHLIGICWVCKGAVEGCCLGVSGVVAERLRGGAGCLLGLYEVFTGRLLCASDSAGVGRTGIFIALSIVLERMRFEGVVDLFQTVKTLRTQRPAMVQTEVGDAAGRGDASLSFFTDFSARCFLLSGPVPTVLPICSGIPGKL